MESDIVLLNFSINYAILAGLGRLADLAGLAALAALAGLGRLAGLELLR